MKLFLSWSGDLSHRVALILRDWLPSVIQAVRPYVSSEDIDKGARWSTDIATELDQSSYGIICVTRDNLDAPWINFEAGALSKSIDKSNVTPFLFHVKRSEVQGPLLQFQSVIYEKEEIIKLIRSVNRKLDDEERLAEDHLQKTFEVWWPQLQKELETIPERSNSRRVRSVGTRGENEEILEEILELVRSQQRLLKSPEALLPRGYLASIISSNVTEASRRKLRFGPLHAEILEVEHTLRNETEGGEIRARLLALTERVHELIHTMDDRILPTQGRVRRIREADNLDVPTVLRRVDKDEPEK